ncbi:MAG: hypothetical protein ISS00_04215 [Candidatus Marinimicrobia bacterium]|nr:hypothetical protein [Candidatus Neomarinimicrobiota bacterium]
MRSLILLFSVILWGQVADSTGEKFSMSGGVGTVTIDGKTYNQLAFRPEIPIWKFGIGLDLAFYFDEEGNFLTDDWEGAGALTQKIMYLRFGKPYDKYYFRAGLLQDVTLGYGILVNHYTNGLKYPAVKQMGLTGKIKTDFGGLEFFSSNLEQSFFGVRAFINPASKLEIGLSVVKDGNMFDGLTDSDGDGYPNLLDGFPDDANSHLDSDGDGEPDDTDKDADGDGITDNEDFLHSIGIYDTLDHSVDVDENPFQITDANRHSISAFALDIGYPIYESGNMRLTTYAQLAAYSQFYNDSTGKYEHPVGFAPGIRLDSGPVSVFTEYRNFSTKFVSEFFNRTYDIERATVFGDTVQTKDEMLTAEKYPKRAGWMAGANIDFGTFGSFGATFQNMTAGEIVDKSIYSTLKLNVSKIPKMQSAEAFYQQTNVEDWFTPKSESTILGYRIGFDVSDGVTLFYKFQKTFSDTDGDGILEPITFTQIETAFSF